MRGATIIMIISSLVFILLGLIILLNKKIRSYIGGGMSEENHKRYIKFMGSFYLIIGAIGVGLGILDFFFREYSLYFVVIFVAVMLTSGLIQTKLSAKYIK
ncbi:MAG: hypothetical protein ABRQ27_04985 [Clostridiaceae bacterium]